MQINIKPQNDVVDYSRNEREKEKYITILEKNPLEMSNTERKNRQVDELVISRITKNNDVNNAEELTILTSSLLFSFSLPPVFYH
jgi:hypothetical protein